MKSALALLAIAACQPATPSLPWLYGLGDVKASSGIAEPSAPYDDVFEDCGVGASRPIELVADVAPAPGKETIVASYATGVAIFDREDHIVAESGGYRCVGSADELEVVAVGTEPLGERLLALLATNGGRRESGTWISLYHFTPVFEPIFTGLVEHRDDTETTRGTIYLVPNGLIHQQPDGPTVVWKLDPAIRVYVPVLPETPHDEPITVSLR